MTRPLDDHASAGLAAIILAGGRGSRLGGISKPLARLGDTTLLELAIDAVPTGSTVVVVGPPELAVPTGVLRVLEDPPFGGPVAALAAGLAAVPLAAGWLLLLAADQPTVGVSVRILLATERGNDGVIGIDGSGRRQPLAALYRIPPIREVLGDNISLPRRLMDVTAVLALTEVFLGDQLDVDTHDDVHRFGVQVPVTEIVTDPDPGRGRPSR